MTVIGSLRTWPQRKSLPMTLEAAVADVVAAVPGANAAGIEGAAGIVVAKKAVAAAVGAHLTAVQAAALRRGLAPELFVLGIVAPRTLLGRSGTDNGRTEGDSNSEGDDGLVHGNSQWFTNRPKKQQVLLVAKQMQSCECRCRH